MKTIKLTLNYPVDNEMVFTYEFGDESEFVAYKSMADEIPENVQKIMIIEMLKGMVKKLEPNNKEDK